MTRKAKRGSAERGSGRAKLEPVPEIVDPRPLIQERLRVLATEHEPRIAERQRAVDEGESGAKAELRRAKRSYAAARREVKNMRSRGAAW